MALTQVSSDGIKNLNVKTADLENSGVTAGTYGSASLIPALVIDAKGRVTSASTNAITQVGGSNGVDFNDNVKARFGTGNDLEIYHDGTHNRIQNNVANRNIYIEGVDNEAATPFIYLNPRRNQTGLSVKANQGVDLYYDNSKKIETTSGGVTVSGNIDIGGNDFNIADGGQIHLGDGTDLRIYHDGSDSYINDAGTGNLYIVSTDGNINLQTNGSENAVKCIENGAVELYYDNSKKLETTSVGTRLYGRTDIGDSTGGSTDDRLAFGDSQDLQIYHNGTNNIINDANSAKIKIQRGGSDVWELKSTGLQGIDNQKLMLGNADDLQIYHNGTHSVISNNTGTLFTLADNLSFKNAANNEVLFYANANNEFAAYYDNSKKFETLSGGARVYGNLEVEGSSSGVSSTLQLQPYGATGYINHTGSGTVFIRMGSGYTTRFQLTNDGHFQPNANNAQDLGSTSLRWRNIYTNDLNLSNEGGANDVDGTWGSFTIQEGAEDLFLINKRNGKKYKFNLTEVS
jgi:hypothetical protein